jgi:hypothetical protein
MELDRWTYISRGGGFLRFSAVSVRGNGGVLQFTTTSRLADNISAWRATMPHRGFIRGTVESPVCGCTDLQRAKFASCNERYTTRALTSIIYAIKYKLRICRYVPLC